MKKGKKFFCIALALLMLLSILPVSDVGIEAEAATLTLAELQAKYPAGKYWNHAGNPGSSNAVNNPNGYTSTPCSVHGVVGTSKQTCNGFTGGGSTQLSWQCMGFAEQLGYLATGYNPRNNANGWSTKTNASALNNLKAGDIVRYKNDGHSIYVTNVSGNTVTYADCNSDGHCIIRWGQTISKSTLQSSFTHVRSAPSALSGGSSGGSHTRDTAYGTDFAATANTKINVFNADHSDPGNYYIDAGDQCTIHEVYTDGCCKVTYPSSASPTGTRTYYAKISDFSVSNIADPIISLVYWGDNGTTTHCRPVVQIENPETVSYVRFPTWCHSGDGSQNNLNWYESVYNGGNCWFNDIAYNDFAYQYIESHCYVYGKNGSTQSVSLPRSYNKNYTYNLDINEVIDGTKYETGVSDFTFDVYIDGVLAANDVCDWAMAHYCGQTYEINDIKCRSGYVFAGGNTSGQLTEHTEVVLNFVQGTGVLDLNGMLDGGESGAIGSYGTVDVYINGSLASAGCWDYCETLPSGTKYEIKNIKAATGKQYNGVYSGSLSGTIQTGQTTKVLLDFSTSSYQLLFDVNHDNIGLNLYKPTKSSKTINGVNYIYDLTTNTFLLNGTMNVSGGEIDVFSFTPAANSYYKVTAKIISGSISNGILVIEAKDGSKNSVGSRIYADIFSNLSKTWYFSSADASSTKYLQTWLYCAEGKTASFSNAVVQVKIEKVSSASSGGTEFSPCMRGMHYDESYSTLMTPTRTGYTFDGWYTAKTGGEKITSASRYPANNQTLYAHWTCNHCSTEVRNAKSATCTATGYTGDTYCKTCGTKTKTGTSIAAKGHTWTAATCTAAKTCSVCKATDGSALGHSYTSAVTKAATCTADGVKTYTCSTCGNSYTEAIAKTGHKWTAATCTAAKTCSVCKATDGSALGHSYTSAVTKAATCTTDGVKTFTCSKCSHSYTETIAKTGHKAGAAATCTTDQVCTVCNTVLTAKTGHKWTAATCTAPKTCSVCKATEGSALGHSYTSAVTKAATCTADGVKTFTCSKCNHSYTEAIAKTGHKWTAATCTAPKTCSVCKATEGNALGHSYTSAVTKAATCTTDGVKTFTCSKCNHSYTEAIAKTGHKAGATATCTTDQICTICNTVLTAKTGHNWTAATCVAILLGWQFTANHRNRTVFSPFTLGFHVQRVIGVTVKTKIPVEAVLPYYNLHYKGFNHTFGNVFFIRICVLLESILKHRQLVPVICDYRLFVEL